jgi:anti-anti-sigma factor
MSESNTPPLVLKSVAGVTVASIASPKLGLDARDALYELVDKNGAKKIVLNLENIQILSSAPIGMLVNLRNKLHSTGGSLALCAVGPYVREILQLTRLEGLFSILDTEQDAIESLIAA